MSTAAATLAPAEDDENVHEKISRLYLDDDKQRYQRKSKSDPDYINWWYNRTAKLLRAELRKGACEKCGRQLPQG
ncbi:hypothetical protein QQ045_029362 [Rhodiola kirilowii]